MVTLGGSAGRHRRARGSAPRATCARPPAEPGGAFPSPAAPRALRHEGAPRPPRSPADADDDLHGAADSRPARLLQPVPGEEGREDGAGDSGSPVAAAYVPEPGPGEERGGREREEMKGEKPNVNCRAAPWPEEQGAAGPVRAAPERSAKGGRHPLHGASLRCRASIGRLPPRRGQWASPRRRASGAHWVGRARLAPDRAAARPLGGVYWPSS